jgi:hypothetical protein
MSKSPSVEQSKTTEDNYESLARALHGAYKQASEGKGKERHASDEPFQDQKICVMSRWLKGSPVGGVLFQAMKKIAETATFANSIVYSEDDKVFRQVRELRGAINYLAAAIILLEESEGGPGVLRPKPVSSQIPVSQCAVCIYSSVGKDNAPCKKCYNLPFKPHFTPYV